MMGRSSLHVHGPVRPGDKSSDVRTHGYTCNCDSGDSGAQPKRWDTEDLQFRTQKHGVYYAPTRINRLLGLVNVYIWIGILFCCVHLGSAQNNTTQDTNMTTVGLTTIVVTTDLPEFTTDLSTTEEGSNGNPVKPWVYGVAAVGGVVVIVVIIIIIICCRKKKCTCTCTCTSSSPPSPVNKDFTPSEDGIDGGNGYHDGYTDDNQGNVGIAMEPLEHGIEESIYQNTAVRPLEVQDNPAFGYSHSVSLEDYPDNPPPAPPTGASNINMGIPSPFMPPLPSPGPMPSSPIDIPNRPPPAVPKQGAKDIKKELNDKFKGSPLPGKPNDKKKKKKKEKDDKPKTPQRFIDPNEQIREEVPGSQTSQQSYPDNFRSPAIKLEFSTRRSQPEASDDFGGNYEPMSPVKTSPVKSWSPRQPEEGDCGDIYEDVGGDGDDDYGDDYEDVDELAPQQARKPIPAPFKLPGQRSDGDGDDDYGVEYEDVDGLAPQQARKPVPAPFKLPGQRSHPDINQRPMVQPPATSGGDDFGDIYEDMGPSASPKHQLPGRNIDHRPQVPLPIQEDDHGGVYEEMTSPTVSSKRRPPAAKPKITKKPIKSPAAGDFGQEYGNTGVSATLPISTTQRLPPSIPSSSMFPQTFRGLSKEEQDDVDWLPPPPPPPELDQHRPPSIPSHDQLDHGELYDDVEIKQTNRKKPALVPKPKVSKKPSNTISSSTTLPHISPKPQVSPTKPPSSATLPPVSDRGEPTEEVYMNLPALKGNSSKLYHNLPAPEKMEEQISSGGYSFFSERPK